MALASPGGDDMNFAFGRETSVGRPGVRIKPISWNVDSSIGASTGSPVTPITIVAPRACLPPSQSARYLRSRTYLARPLLPRLLLFRRLKFLPRSRPIRRRPRCRHSKVRSASSTTSIMGAGSCCQKASTLARAAERPRYRQYLVRDHVACRAHQ